MKLISSLVKPSQLIFPSLILIKLCNTSILVHTLSDIMCQSIIIDLIDNMPSLSDVHVNIVNTYIIVYIVPVYYIGT